MCSISAVMSFGTKVGPTSLFFVKLTTLRESKIQLFSLRYGKCSSTTLRESKTQRSPKMVAAGPTTLTQLSSISHGRPEAMSSSTRALDRTMTRAATSPEANAGSRGRARSANLTYINVTFTSKVLRWKLYLQDKDFDLNHVK